MTFRKVSRIFLWSAGALTVAVLALYLLRWPLLESTIRAKVGALIAEQLHADPDIQGLEGNLLRSLTATNVTLRPKADAVFRSARADRIHRVRSIAQETGFAPSSPRSV